MFTTNSSNDEDEDFLSKRIKSFDKKFFVKYLCKIVSSNNLLAFFSNFCGSNKGINYFVPITKQWCRICVKTKIHEEFLVLRL